MVIANANKHIAPYWGEEPNLTAGLNQLGVRNVAEQLFTSLLPGLNNVSIRIRYYSFYCWIIMQFYEGKETVIDKDFNIFIRRAELLVALINATLDDRSGIPGINFAAAKVDSGAVSFSLTEGADITPGRSTYWANPGGILRQYYIASLQEMGLIGQNEQYPSIYNITKTGAYVNGLKLAQEFAVSAGDKCSLFLDILKKGTVTSEELRDMNRAFDMKYSGMDKQERESLRRMLLQTDNPLEADSKSHRRETIKYILEYLSKYHCQLKASGFSRYMYGLQGQTENLTAWGWYAYFLDNNWQYQLTRIFHDVLTELKLADERWIPVEDVSKIISDKVIFDFQINNNMPVNEFINLLDGYRRENPTAEAVRDLLFFYRNNRFALADSEIHYHEMGIRAENFGDFIKSTDEALDMPLYDFVKKLIEDIIYRHYRVSFRKMLQTQKATQKFAFENGCLSFIDDWEATDTSPRIDTMRNFLIDLNILKVQDGTDVLTDSGLKLLEELTNGDTAA